CRSAFKSCASFGLPCALCVLAICGAAGSTAPAAASCRKWRRIMRTSYEPDRFSWLRYCDCGRWKNWSSRKISRQVPCETIEEVDDVSDFAILDFYSQLHASHDFDRFRKRRY